MEVPYKAPGSGKPPFCNYCGYSVDGHPHNGCVYDQQAFSHDPGLACTPKTKSFETQWKARALKAEAELKALKQRNAQ